MSALADFGGTVESWAKALAATSAAAVGLVYLCGYLSLRTQMTALGIPAEWSTFDQRYLFAGASFLIALAQVLLLLVDIAVRGALALAILGAVAWLLLRRRARTILLSGVKWQRHLAIAAAVASVAISLVAITRAEQWLLLQDLLFVTDLEGDALIIAAQGDEWHWIFLKYLAATVASGALILVTVRRATHTRLWAGAATLALAVQMLSLPMLFGVLTADSPRARIILNGQRGWLMWEDGGTLIYLRDSAPLEVERHAKSAEQVITIAGYDRVLRRRVPAAATQPTKSRP
jgi:hypothetical protein